MIRITRKTFALFAVAVLGAAGCTDNPVEPSDEHEDPAEVVILLGGAELARAGVTESGEISGALTVAAGEETAHLSVVFLDEHGDEVELDDDVYLEVEIADEAIATFEQDTPGEFGGHLHGETAGATTATFKLMHGEVGNGHEDFTSEAIPVTVN